METPDNGKRDLLELLYEGGDESGLDEAEQRELARLRDLRGVMREVGAASEVEPPNTMAILMAAARQRTPEPRGLFARLRAWFSVMAAHPAMSAAATVVLVAGVAGTLYVTGRVKSEGATESVASSRATEASSGATAPNAAAPTANELAPSAAAGSGSGSAAGSAGVIGGQAGEGSAVASRDQSEDRGPIADDKPMPKAEPPRATASHRADKPKVSESAGRASGKGAAAGDDLDDGVADGRAATAKVPDSKNAAREKSPPKAEEAAKPDETFADTPAAVAAPAPETEQRRAPAPQPAPAKPTAPAGAPPTEAPVARARTPESPAPPPPPAPTTQAPPAQAKKKSDASAAQLTQAARGAAQRKDCKTVDALAKRVIEIDAAYYRANFATDRDIRSNCTAATTLE